MIKTKRKKSPGTAYWFSCTAKVDLSRPPSSSNLSLFLSLSLWTTCWCSFSFVHGRPKLCSVEHEFGIANRPRPLKRRIEQIVLFLLSLSLSLSFFTSVLTLMGISITWLTILSLILSRCSISLSLSLSSGLCPSLRHNFPHAVCLHRLSLSFSFYLSLSLSRSRKWFLLMGSQRQFVASLKSHIKATGIKITFTLFASKVNYKSVLVFAPAKRKYWIPKVPH